MKNSVEAKKANEALPTNAVEEEDNKYPTFDIQRLTSTASQFPREIISMHATSKTTYDKFYSPLGLDADGNAKPIRRTKHVKLPVTVDGKMFHDTWNLWNYLTTASGGYSRVPKKARRDKIPAAT